MTRTLLAMAVIVIGVTGAVAQSDVVAARQKLMMANGEHGYRVLNRMVRGQLLYDQAKVDAAFKNFTETAPKIPGLFPPGSYKGPVADSDYYASQKIFENQNDLKARAEKFAKEVADNKDKVKDLASLKAIWPAMNKNNCNSCHEAYRLKKG